MTSQTKSVSKRLYKFHEGVVRLALVLGGVPETEIFWGERVLGIDTDLVVGPTLDAPQLVVQVRHSGSPKEQDKKFWRQMHELVELKTALEVAPVSISVVFEDRVKERLFIAEQAMFDSVLRVPSQSYGPDLMAFSRPLVTGPLWSRSEMDCYEYLRRMTDEMSATHSPKFSRSMAAFAEDLSTLLERAGGQLDDLWSLIKETTTRSVEESLRAEEWTFCKKGLAKLLIFTASERAAVIDSIIGNKSMSHAESYSLELGLVRRFSTFHRSMIRVADSELRDAVTRIGREGVEAVLAAAPLERMEQLYLQPIRELLQSPDFLEGVQALLPEIARTNSTMEDALRRCFSDPSGFAGELGLETDTERHWIVDSVMCFARTATTRNQGYGYTQLAADSDAPELVEGWVVLSDYCSRTCDLEPRLLAKLASGLRVAVSRLPTMTSVEVSSAARGQAAHLIETRLFPYRSFDPIGTLVLRTVEAHGYSLRRIPRHPTVPTEFAGVAAATCKVHEVRVDGRRCLIMWQSPNKNSRDKQKEFCGRIALLRAQWDEDAGRFKRRDVDLAIFIADGKFTSFEKKQLLHFGFDAVISPFQLDVLADLLRG